MKKYSLKKLQEIYDIDLKNVIKKIEETKSKIVLLQFPDGLKPYAKSIVDYLEGETIATFLIWMGSCFGACDTPTGLEKISPKIELIIQFGHNSLMPTYLK